MSQPRSDPRRTRRPEIGRRDEARRLFPERPPSRRADRLRQDDLLPPPRPVPTRGWRAWLYRLTGGLLNLGLSPEEQHDRGLAERLETAKVHGHRHIAVLSLKGGPGKCLKFDETVIDPRTGLSHTIEELVEDDSLSEVLTLVDQRRVEVVPITAKVDSGEQECLRVTFSSGRTITTTLGHPFLLPDGWRRADQLAVGKAAALPARIPFPTEPVELLPAELDILAVLLAEDGSTGRGARISTNDAEIPRCVTAAAEALGAGRLAKNKVMPPAVYRLPPRQLARFLAVFWMCDGYVDDDGPAMTLASESLIRALQHLLLRFGIQSTVRPRSATSSGRHVAAWRLAVYAHCWSTFRETIPLWGAERARLDALCDDTRRNANAGDPSASPCSRAELHAIARHRSRAAGMPTPRQVADRPDRGHFRDDLPFQRRTGTISRRTLREFCEVSDSKETHERPWSPDVFWDRITAIEHVGVHKVYDLMVEPTRCFIASDVVVHNTTTTVMLGHTLAQYRGDRVVALDASPDAGTLGFRVERQTANSMPDLLLAAKDIEDYRDLRAYTSQSPSRLEVLAARTEPDLSSPFSADQYRDVTELLSRFYSLIITDCSPGLLHPTMEPVLEVADQLLIVVSPSVDGGRSGNLMLDWLSAHGRDDLVRNAILVLNCLQERPLVDVRQFEAHFGKRCRAVVRIPYDPHLGQGGETSLEALRAATRTAYLRLAVAVIEHDPRSADRAGRPR